MFIILLDISVFTRCIFIVFCTSKTSSQVKERILLPQAYAGWT